MIYQFPIGDSSTLLTIEINQIKSINYMLKHLIPFLILSNK